MAVIKPTRVQFRMLKAICTEGEMAFRDARAGQTRPMNPTKVEASRRHMALRVSLESAAVAGGVPQEWIGQARARGDLGMKWRRDLHWRDPAPISRSTLLTALGEDAFTVLGTAAVAAAHGERGARAEVGTAQLFDRKFILITNRFRALVNLLEVTPAEAASWNDQRLLSAVADTVRNAGPAEVADWWRSYARQDRTEHEWQARALQHAGITAADGEHVFPTAEQIRQRMVQVLATGSPPDPSSDRAGGHAIAAAIKIAGVTSEAAGDLDTGTTSLPLEPQGWTANSELER
jgi:hypothetical protein